MNIELRNKKYWEYIPTFVKKVVCLPSIGINILGYFPYHTAKIGVVPGPFNVRLPRMFFEEFEKLTLLNHMYDNKCVYICIPSSECTHACEFALMVKDDYVLIGTWESVTNYDGTPLKVKT